MKRYLSVFLILMSVVLSFSSCNEDIMDEVVLQGKCWRVTNAPAHSPYDIGDLFSFYSNDRFVVQGVDGMVEYGTWRVKHKKLQLHFDGSSYDVDIEAPIPFLDDNYCTLECFDYVYDCNYNLNLVYVLDLE